MLSIINCIKAIPLNTTIKLYNEKIYDVLTINYRYEVIDMGCNVNLLTHTVTCMLILCIHIM